MLSLHDGHRCPQLFGTTPPLDTWRLRDANQPTCLEYIYRLRVLIHRPRASGQDYIRATACFITVADREASGSLYDRRPTMVWGAECDANSSGRDRAYGESG